MFFEEMQDTKHGNVPSMGLCKCTEYGIPAWSLA